MAGNVVNTQRSSRRTGVWKRKFQRDETGRLVPVMIILAPVDEMENRTPSCVPFMSVAPRPVFPIHMQTQDHTNRRWQSGAGACGFSPVTAACSQGGDASGAAPRIGEACLCWPRINNFSFSAEMTGIVIKEME